MAGDIAELILRKWVLEAKISAALAEKGCRDGKSVGFLGELECNLHQGAVFESISTIPDDTHRADSRRMQGKKGLLGTYSCGGCIAELGISAQATSAYDCPTCGVVYGRYMSRELRDSNRSRSLPPRSGRSHYCGVCETSLGVTLLEI